MITRLMRLLWWIGHSGTSAVMAAQFGLAMMPLWSRMRFALISGITSGTFGSIRKAEELSTTTAPALTAIGAILLRDAAAGGEQGDVDAFEGALGQLLDDDVLPAERHRLAGRAGAGQRLELADAKAALVHGGDEFGAHRTGDADNRDDGIVTHFVLH